MSKPTGKRRREARARLSLRQLGQNVDEVCCLCGRALGFDQATFDAPDGSPRVYCLDCFSEGVRHGVR